MTNPTITYNHGFLTDCNDKTSWNKTDSADPLTVLSLTVLNNDEFRITGTCDAVADEYAYYQYTIAPTISSDIYTKWLLRWKTGVASNGLGAKVVIGFTVGNQFILGETAPEFATTWQVASGDVTAGKTINSVAFWADDYPDTIAAGAFDVYYDFLLLHEGTFTFPYVSGGCDMDISPKNALIGIPSRVTDINQNLGAKSTEVHIWGDMDTRAAWKGTNSVIGEVFRCISHQSESEPWQWLDLGEDAFKAVMTEPSSISRSLSKKTMRTFDFNFREYRRSCGSVETYSERFNF